MTTEAAEPTRAADVLRRPWVAALIVLAVYGVLAQLNSTGGYLGTDTGAKVITLDRMAENDTFSPAIGYWAEEWDPDGDYHPLFDTRQNDDGEWVNVTTLPMLVVARPLYELGGYRLALLLPMLGALLAAFAARNIVRQQSSEGEGWSAFWLVALASPITIYALDLWEHSIGAGLMLAAFAVLLRVARGPSPWWIGLLAGTALGLSAAMRTETFVVAFVFVGGVCVSLLLRRRLTSALITGATTTVAFAALWFLNGRLEEAVGGTSRADRVTSVATTSSLVNVTDSTGASELSTRFREALLTWFGLPVGEYPANVALGGVVVLGLIAAGVMARREDLKISHLLLALVVSCYLIAGLSGLGFVSGALVAAPAAGLVVLSRSWSLERVGIAGMAVTATVLTWAFQFTGGAGPQWGGRYILVPTLVLVCLGVVAVRADGQMFRRTVFGLSAAVTIFGVVWLQQRSHAVEGFFQDLAERPEEVVISTNGFLVREAGTAYDDRLYLSIGRGADVEGAVDLVVESGRSTFGLLTFQSVPAELDAELKASDQVNFLGVPLWYHSYEVEAER